MQKHNQLPHGGSPDPENQKAWRLAVELACQISSIKSQGNHRIEGCASFGGTMVSERHLSEDKREELVQKVGRAQHLCSSAGTTPQNLV